MKSTYVQESGWIGALTIFPNGNANYRGTQPMVSGSFQVRIMKNAKLPN